MEETTYENSIVNKLCGKRKRDIYEGTYVYEEKDTINILENGVKFLFIHENPQEKKIAKQNE